MSAVTVDDATTQVALAIAHRNACDRRLAAAMAAMDEAKRQHRSAVQALWQVTSEQGDFGGFTRARKKAAGLAGELMRVAQEISRQHMGKAA